MNENELQQLVELQKQAALDKEFGHPINTFVGNLAEKAGGVASSLGYLTNSPTLSQWGNDARNYGKRLMPQGQYTYYDKGAEYLGQTVPALALGYATKSPFLATTVDGVSEIGTIINELQNQGYSEEEINKKILEAVPSEMMSGFASGTLGKIGLNLIKNQKLGGLGRKIFGGQVYGLGQVADQPLQNIIYDDITRGR